ncbi:MAG: rhomboid family intramembrane serine protease [Thermonemataceae bacterium]
MKITYNAPFTLTYTFICLVIIILDLTLFASETVDGREVAGIITQRYFTVYPFGTEPMRLSNPLAYFRLISHTMGHGSWLHFFGNFSLILLIGPILEEKYGSKKLLYMSLATALITGLLNAIFFDSGLLGASGIVFMLILLASFTNVQRGVIPLTFILILVIYLGKEIYDAFSNDQISQFAHIIGGICGSIFGYVMGGKKDNGKSLKTVEERTQESILPSDTSTSNKDDFMDL